jgi:hypothetical protein
MTPWLRALMRASVLTGGGGVIGGGPGAPTAAGLLTAKRFFGNSGVETYDVSGDFTGTSLVYSLVTPPTGVTIHASTGVVSVDTDAIAAAAGFYRTLITIRAENVDGYANSSFNLSVCTIHYCGTIGDNSAASSFDLSTLPALNRRVWVTNYSGFDRGLTIDGVAATSLIGHNYQIGTTIASRIYTSTTADATVNLAWSGSLSNGLTMCWAAYGYADTLTDTAYAQDSGGDADASVLTDINAPTGGAVVLMARSWETITTPGSGMQVFTANNFCVGGRIIVEAGDATYDLQVDTDTSTANKVMMAFSLAPLAA